MPEKALSHAQIKRLVICALLTALGVVIGGLLTIPAMPLGVYSIKIGFGVLPVILSGVLYGPLYGGIVGGLTDLLQALLFPKGAYVPWFTLIGALFGLIPGLFFMRGQTASMKRLFMAIASGQIAGSLICNTLLLVWLYNLPFWATLAGRALNQAVMIPLYAVLVYYIVRLLRKNKIV